MMFRNENAWLWNAVILVWIELLDFLDKFYQEIFCSYNPQSNLHERYKKTVTCIVTLDLFLINTVILESTPNME